MKINNVRPTHQHFKQNKSNSAKPTRAAIQVPEVEPELEPEPEPELDPPELEPLCYWPASDV